MLRAIANWVSFWICRAGILALGGYHHWPTEGKEERGATGDEARMDEGPPDKPGMGEPAVEPSTAAMEPPTAPALRSSRAGHERDQANAGENTCQAHVTPRVTPC